MNKVTDQLRFAVLATDVVLFRIHDESLEVLTIPVANPEYRNVRALPGGLILPSETAEASVARHLKEKGGVQDVYTEQLYTFSALQRDKRGRVVSVAYLGLTEGQGAKQAAEDAQWEPVNGIGTLAYDHNDVLRVAVERLQAKLAYTDIVRHLLPSEFTLSELQAAYECVLERTLDKRNFRKKILALNLLKKTNKERRGEANRPAAVYKWATKNHQVIDIL